MGTLPAPDLRNMTIEELIDALAQGQVDSPLHKQATIMLPLRIAEQQAAASNEQAVAAREQVAAAREQVAAVREQVAAVQQQAEAAHAVVAPTRTLARYTKLLAVVAAIT